MPARVSVGGRFRTRGSGLLARHLPSYDEVASIAAFAASDCARIITASEINFTGGAVVD